VSDGFIYYKNYSNKTQLNPDLSLSLSDIDFTNSKNGEFSGWKYNLVMPVRQLDAEDIGLAVTYVHQTNNLVMSFSFDYRMDWSKLL